MTSKNVNMVLIQTRLIRSMDSQTQCLSLSKHHAPPCEIRMIHQLIRTMVKAIQKHLFQRQKLPPHALKVHPQLCPVCSICIDLVSPMKVVHLPYILYVWPIEDELQGYCTGIVIKVCFFWRKLKQFYHIVKKHTMS